MAFLQIGPPSVLQLLAPRPYLPRPTGLNDSDLLRYSRHILLPEIGLEGQMLVAAATVLLVGAGGLGCPAALYLGSAGTGRMIIADGDVVELTNLQRQIGFRNADIGRNKAHALAQRVLENNPGIAVDALAQRLESNALTEAVQQADVVLDCSDNFATRHAVNRACVNLGKPLVSGAALGFSGQLAVFGGNGPCYRCLFGTGEDAAPRCSETGVFAPLVGIMGAAQAAEALKLLIGIGETLAGRLLLFDALAATWREIRVPRDPACPVCSALRPAV